MNSLFEKNLKITLAPESMSQNTYFNHFFLSEVLDFGNHQNQPS